MDGVATVVDVAEVDAFAAGSEQDRFPLLLAESAEGCLHVEVVVPREGLQQVEVVDVVAVPPADRAVGDAQARVGNDQVGVEVLLHAESVAFLAGADRIVEGKEPGFEFDDAVAALGTGETRREHEVFAVDVVVDEADRRNALGEIERGFEGLREALLRVWPHA